MLRCTLAGMIPLMACKKYSVLGEVFYEFRRGDFDNIIKSKSWYLIREIPRQIALDLFSPQIMPILARQKGDGLWPAKDPIKETYDILSALQHIEALDKLEAENQLKNVLETVRDKFDYYSLLIKTKIYGIASVQDILAIGGMIEQIKNSQMENGSFENTVFATAYHLEMLLNLGVSRQDPSMQKAVSFLIDHLNRQWPQTGDKRGICTSYVFSSRNWSLEFQAAQKYRPETEPRQTCFCRLGVLQNAYCIKVLINLGHETDAHVQAAMDSILAMIKQYQGLCYFDIQKKVESMKNASAFS